MNRRNAFSFCLYALLITCMLPPPGMANEITLKNWMSHKSIKEIRQIYHDIRKGVETKEYRIREYRGDRNCDDFNCTTYQFEIMDRNGFILACGMTLYNFSVSYEKNIENYYDRDGMLRFRLKQSKYFHLGKTEREETRRLYVDKSGNSIWGIHMVDGEVEGYRSDYKRSSHIKTNRSCRKYRWGE